MKRKVYIFQWSYNHRGEFDCGFYLCTDKEYALEKMQECYNQAIFNITPNNSEKELDMNEYSEKELSDCHGYYYAERYAADSWERGEIIEKTIDFPEDEAAKKSGSNDLQMWSGGYTEEELVGYDVVLWPDSQDLMELDGFDENSYLINDEAGLEIFGSSAYVVSKMWLDSQNSDEITKY